MERKEAIRSAYRLTGSSFYDGMMTCSTLPGRLVCRLVWDMDKQMCSEYQEKALSGIPEDFSGRMLEVPVGTGILTMPLPRQRGGLPRDLPGAAPRRNVLRLLLRVGCVPADGPAHPARI